MALWVLAALPIFESGFWLGQMGLQSRQREKVRERLIWGRKPATRIMVVDTQLKKLAGHASKRQQFVTDRLIRGSRWAVNTKAFEYLILRAIKDRWPKGKRIDPRVKVCL